jgi:endo-1,4-beta-xylanase
MRFSLSSRRWVRIVPLGMALFALAACSDGGGGTGPDPDDEEGPYSMEMTPATTTLLAGRQVQLAAVVRNASGQEVTPNPGIAWTSSNAAVATVDAAGRVTAVSAGTATIRGAVARWAAGDSTVLTVTPRSLRILAAERGMWMGTAVGYTGTTFPSNAVYVGIVGREFNLLVAENVMKWQTMRRDGPASWRFQFMDELLAYAEANGMKVRGHPLAWHSGNPGWLDALTTANTTRAQAIELLEQHVDSVVTRYRGRIRDYDVVNEVIADGGGGGRRPAAESVWERLIGPDWVDVAFRAAAAADPAARLFYNDYSIETDNAKQAAVFNLVKDLKDRGISIHGVGFQAHFISGGVPSADALRTSMDRFAALGLEVQLTELDIRIQGAVTAEKLTAQAEEYRRVIGVCVQHPACGTVVVWGIDDGNSWIPGTFPGYGAAHLYDSALVPKPAYFGVDDALDVQ